MLDIIVSDRWHDTFEGGHVGVLAIGGVDNSQPSPLLDERKRALESKLRERFRGYARNDYFELKVLKAYRDYYKQFGNTYHVQAQLESVVGGRSLPNVSPLVDANFAAELETLVLTAGHDADLLKAPVTIDATQGGEAFTQLNGKTRTLKPHDMMMRDGAGTVCTILYGQDKRTPISPKTTRALYVAYAPVGVGAEAVSAQLEAVRDNVLLFATDAEVELLELYSAEGEDA